MKKKILISLLTVTFFNYIGCGPSLFSSGYSGLSEDEINEGRPEADESIKLILNDGTEIDCDPLSVSEPSITYYYRVITPGRFLLGRGGMTNNTTGEASSFKGVVSGDMIDSSSMEIKGLIEYSIYWTKDNNRLSFEKGKSIEILPELGTGYFLWQPDESLTKIAFDEIKAVQIKESDSLVGVLLIGILVTTMIFIALLSSADFPGGD